MAQVTTGGEWDCPPLAEALDISGMFTIKEYIHKRQDTVERQGECLPYMNCTRGKSGCQ